MSRRGLLAGGAGAAAATVASLAFVKGDGAADDITAQASAPWTPLPTPGASYFHIVAHPDDDLYFFNPDLEQSIRSGARVTSVVITAAEDDGKNHPRWAPDYAAFPSDPPAYVAARGNGLRAAYAAMAVGDQGSPWRREAVQTHDGAVVEIAALIAADRVRLVFLYLHDVVPDQPGASLISQLWEGTRPSLTTVVAPGSPVKSSSTYTAETLTATLVDLMRDANPTVVRTMDPDPEQRGKEPRFNGFGSYADNGDHTAAGLFAVKALQQYQVQSSSGRVQLESYRGYCNERWPHGLSAVAYRRKLTYLGVYGSGDLKVGADARIVGWGRTTGYRYPGTTTWLRKGADGCLAAFAVLGGQTVMWSEKAPGSGTWSGPRRLDGPPMAPHVTPALSKDGRWQVFGLAMTLAGPPGDQRRPVIAALQESPGGRFSPWVEVGTPNEPADQRRAIGVPAAGLSPDDRAMVFVRDWGMGISGSTQRPDGTWGPWTDLGGDALQDGLFCLDEPSALELYGTSDTSIVAWSGGSRAKVWPVRKDPPLVASAGPVTAAADTATTRVLIARQPDTGWVLGYRRTGPDLWNPAPVMLGSHGGFGPVAAVAQRDRIFLAERNDAGTVSVAWAKVNPDAAPEVPKWVASGPLIMHMPATAIDAEGQVVVASLAATGRLYVARQKNGANGLEKWTAVG